MQSKGMISEYIKVVCCCDGFIETTVLQDRSTYPFSLGVASLGCFKEVGRGETCVLCRTPIGCCCTLTTRVSCWWKRGKMNVTRPGRTKMLARTEVSRESSLFVIIKKKPRVASWLEEKERQLTRDEPSREREPTQPTRNFEQHERFRCLSDGHVSPVHVHNCTSKAPMLAAIHEPT